MLPANHAFVNGSTTALGSTLPECKGSVAPDGYFIKVSADSPAIAIAREVALEPRTVWTWGACREGNWSNEGG